MSETLSSKTYGVFDGPANRRIISLLAARGDDYLVLPSVRTTGIDEAISDLNFWNNDWMVFTDVFAVRYFLEFLTRGETDIFSLDELTIVANGEAVADKLRFAQLHADVIPSQTDTKSCFDAILQYASGDLSETRFLVVEAQNRAFGLVSTLRSKGAECVSLTVYVADFEAPTARVRSLIKGGAADGIIFDSPEEVESFAMLAASEDLVGFLGGTSVFAVNENAFQRLRECGLRPLFFK